MLATDPRNQFWLGYYLENVRTGRGLKGTGRYQGFGVPSDPIWTVSVVDGPSVTIGGQRTAIEPSDMVSLSVDTDIRIERPAAHRRIRGDLALGVRSSWELPLDIDLLFAVLV